MKVCAAESVKCESSLPVYYFDIGFLCLAVKMDETVLLICQKLSTATWSSINQLLFFRHLGSTQL